VYITVDGPDGSGKSTLVASIVRELSERGVSVLQTKEPGSEDPFCKEIRRLVLHSATPIDPTAEFFAFMSDRMQHLAQIVAPAERVGAVCSDRSVLSGVCYAAATGIEIPFLNTIVAVSNIKIPDISFITSSSTEFVEQVFADRAKDRIESRPLAYRQAVSEMFESLPFEFISKWNVCRLPPTNTLSKGELAKIAVEKIWTLL
jgi:dTMP kinase